VLAVGDECFHWQEPEERNLVNLFKRVTVRAALGVLATGTTFSQDIKLRY